MPVGGELVFDVLFAAADPEFQRGRGGVFRQVEFRRELDAPAEAGAFGELLPPEFEDSVAVLRRGFLVAVIGNLVSGFRRKNRERLLRRREFAGRLCGGKNRCRANNCQCLLHIFPFRRNWSVRRVDGVSCAV